MVTVWAANEYGSAMDSRILLRVVLIALCSSVLGCAQDVQLKTKVPAKNPYSKWTKTLDRVSTPNGIRYDLLKRKRRRLNQYVAWVGEHGQHQDGWSESKEDKRIAHLVNAHNAIVLHNALRLQLPDSPDDVAIGIYRWKEGGFYWGSRYRLDGEWTTIRHIAIHDAVNRYQEPLLWFALYDGTRDAPPLRSFSAKSVQSQLKRAARSFINSDRGLSKTDTGWAANPLFFRYKDDFLFWSHASTLCEWMAKYAKDERKAWLQKQGDECALEERPADRSLDVAPIPKGPTPQAKPTIPR
jgi:hypothetical protein